jgi:hypothetical protein
MDLEVMDRKSIALDLNRKGWMARVIHDDLVVTLGEEAIAYSTVTKYLRDSFDTNRGKIHAVQFPREKVTGDDRNNWCQKASLK